MHTYMYLHNFEGTQQFLAQEKIRHKKHCIATLVSQTNATASRFKSVQRTPYVKLPKKVLNFFFGSFTCRVVYGVCEQQLKEYHMHANILSYTGYAYIYIHIHIDIYIHTKLCFEYQVHSKVNV